MPVQIEPTYRIRKTPEWSNGMRLVERIAAARGVAADDMEHFFHPDIRNMPSPADACEGAAGAAEILCRAIRDGKKILAWTDYDADGVCAASILHLLLSGNNANFAIHLPERYDGYGMTMETLPGVYEREKPDLLVTADCGITSLDEIVWLKQRGVEVVVLDHHKLLGELPQADAVCDPHVSGGPFSGFCGAGVAWMISCLTETMLRKPRRKPLDRTGWTILAGIATVADVMPLRGLARDLVQQSLRLLNEGRFGGLSGLEALVAASVRSNQKDRKITARDFGWGIGPLINAAGRIGSPSLAFDVLAKNDASKVGQLVETNAKRQALQHGGSVQLEEAVRGQGNVVTTDFPGGIIGLVAQDISSSTNQPVIIMTQFPDGNWHGSGRSPEGANITELLQKIQDETNCLIRFGGHAAACGVTVAPENLNVFSDAFSNLARGLDIPPPCVVADVAVTGSDLTRGLIDDLAALEPCGEGNPDPLVVLQNATLEYMDTMGQDGAHLRCRAVSRDGCRFRAKAWRLGPLVPELKMRYGKADIVCSLEPSWPDGDGVDLIINSFHEPGSEKKD